VTRASAVGWDSDPLVAAWPGRPAVEGDLTADACVVGLGATGLTAVAELADRGLDVVGVDAGRVGAGAAGRNGGFLLAGPEEPLHTSMELWGSDVALGLYRATLSELDRLGDEAWRVGSIRLAGLPGELESDAEALDREREVADCALQADAMRAHGFAVESYAGPLGVGLFFPSDAATNPARRVVLMAQRLPGRARLFEHSPVRAVTAGVVRTGGGSVRAQHVVVAVDGRLDVLLPALGDRVRTARLQMAAFAGAPAGRLPCPVYCRWGYDYAQQVGYGLFVGGGRDRFVDAEWTTDSSPSDPVQAHIDALGMRFAGGPVRATHRWAASVGFTADGRPLCTAVEPGVMAIGGYNGTGNLVGPVAARAAVAHLLDGTPVPPYFAT
jgi:glycine/D-amino acid oxidase-like deaminating enzyme